MCGIAGYLVERGQAPDPSLIRLMCDRIRHRGPDGEGYFQDGPVTLGHRRLSIIDVEGGAQPLGNEDGSVQIVFNGEIYNFPELMAGLKRRGHRFSTRSDTEVIVHLYEEVGERVPEYLDGMFAFALWDATNRSLLLARDRFGEKPLYYTSAVPGFRFCFASELKALACLPGFLKNVRPQSVAQFLGFSYVPDPFTIYEDVFKLQPGATLLIGEDVAPRARMYWTPSPVQSSGQDFAASASTLDSMARASVGARMISDVPLGGFLSGGVDSSAVVAYMAGNAPGRVKTFSIGFTRAEYDELEYARLVASRYKTDHNEEVVTPAIEDVFDTLVHHFDEPFGDSSAIPTLYLARMTRRHVTVALSGDGADELFGGYRRYMFALHEERARRILPHWFRATVVRGAAAAYPKFDFLPRVFRAKATLSGVAVSLPHAYFRAMSRLDDHALSRLLSSGLRRELAGYSIEDEYVNRFKAFVGLPALTQLQLVDWQTYLPGDILVKVDRATMAHSLESRAPWLDHRLAEYALSLPPEFLINGSAGKRVFKAAVAPHVPDAAIRRSKMGFSVPLAEWFRTSLRQRFEETALAPGMAEFCDLDRSREIWRQHQSGLRNHEALLWNLLMLAAWSRAHRNAT